MPVTSHTLLSRTNRSPRTSPVMVVGLGPMTTTEPSNRSSRTPPRKIRTNNRAPGAAEKAHPISGFLQPDEVIEPAAARVVAMITVATRKHPAAMSPRTSESRADFRIDEDRQCSDGGDAAKNSSRAGCQRGGAPAWLDHRPAEDGPPGS